MWFFLFGEDGVVGYGLGISPSQLSACNVFRSQNKQIYKIMEYTVKASSVKTGRSFKNVFIATCEIELPWRIYYPYGWSDSPADSSHMETQRGSHFSAACDCVSCREVKRQCHLKSQGVAELLTSRTAPWKLSKFNWRKDKVNTVSSRCDHLQRTQGKLYK